MMGSKRMGTLAKGARQQNTGLLDSLKDRTRIVVGKKSYLPSWRLVRLCARFSHRRHGLLGGKQDSGLDGFDMTWRDRGEDGCRDSGLIRHLRDKHAIVLTKGIVEGYHSPSELLDERAENFLAVLWFLDERRPGVGRVSKLRHVERHFCLLLSQCRNN